MADRCPFDPLPYTGAPLGMFHCPECGCMVLAGVEHGPCTEEHCDYFDADASAQIDRAAADAYSAHVESVMKHTTEPRHPLVRELRYLEWRHNQQGWSPPDLHIPSVYWLLHANRNLWTRKVRIPADGWHGHDPVTVLRALPGIISKTPQVVPDRVTGMAFVCEAFADGEECRFAVGVQTDGTSAYQRRFRGKQCRSETVSHQPAIEAMFDLVMYLRQLVERRDDDDPFRDG